MVEEKKKMRARDSEKKKKKEMRVPRKKRKKKIIALHTVLFQSSKMSSGLCTKEVGGGGGEYVPAATNANGQRRVFLGHCCHRTPATDATHVSHAPCLLATYSGNQQHVLQSHNGGP